MNILIPAAGAGKRFREAGYTDPKPLIDVGGKPMLARVIQNVLPPGSHRTVVVAPPGFPRFYDVGVENYEIGYTTDGAARTALLAIHGTQMDLDESLLVANSDQLLDWEPSDFRIFMDGWDGGIVLFPCSDQNPKWSYAQIGRNRIVRVAEKQPISGWATAGIYWWARTGDFVRSATDMICRDERTNGEFYIAPTYNDLIREGKAIFPYYIKAEQMHGLGTPEDLAIYLESLKEKV